jgi:lipopolysaccharide/colanic/teichoic acid biosynthesis glycosyltransferase
MMASMPIRKRLFDLAGAAAGLLVFAPILLVVAGAILLERQRRMTRDRWRRDQSRLAGMTVDSATDFMDDLKGSV